MDGTLSAVDCAEKVHWRPRLRTLWGRPASARQTGASALSPAVRTIRRGTCAVLLEWLRALVAALSRAIKDSSTLAEKEGAAAQAAVRSKVFLARRPLAAPPLKTVDLVASTAPHPGCTREEQTIADTVPAPVQSRRLKAVASLTAAVDSPEVE